MTTEEEIFQLLDAGKSFYYCDSRTDYGQTQNLEFVLRRTADGYLITWERWFDGETTSGSELKQRADAIQFLCGRYPVLFTPDYVLQSLRRSTRDTA